MNNYYLLHLFGQIDEAFGFEQSAMSQASRQSSKKFIFIFSLFRFGVKLYFKNKWNVNEFSVGNLVTTASPTGFFTLHFYAFIIALVFTNVPTPRVWILAIDIIYVLFVFAKSFRFVFSIDNHNEKKGYWENKEVPHSFNSRIITVKSISP